MKPGTATLYSIQFGLFASAFIAAVAPIIPVWGAPLAAAAVASTAELNKKKADQVASMQ